jgi:hypothetical protein
MCNYAWTWYRPDGVRTIEEIAAHFTQTILRGLCPPTDETPDFDGLIIRAIDVVQRAPGRYPPEDDDWRVTPGQ